MCCIRSYRSLVESSSCDAIVILVDASVADDYEPHHEAFATVIDVFIMSTEGSGKKYPIVKKYVSALKPSSEQYHVLVAEECYLKIIFPKTQPETFEKQRTQIQKKLESMIKVDIQNVEVIHGCCHVILTLSAADFIRFVCCLLSPESLWQLLSSIDHLVEIQLGNLLPVKLSRILKTFTHPGAVSLEKTHAPATAIAPFSMKYVFQFCTTFELLVGSKQLSFKLEESTSNEISKSKGGEIELSNSGIIIEFPPDALQEINITISASIFVSLEPVEGRFLSLLELLPHGIKFDRPVVIRSYYHVAGSRDFGSTLHIFYSENLKSEMFLNIFLNYVGKLSEISAKASYSKMDYFLREEFLEIRALSICNLCFWNEGLCKVGFSVFCTKGSDSQFGVFIVLSCAQPEILDAIKNYHVQKNSKGFLTMSVSRWNESWRKMEIALESDGKWVASQMATFMIEDRNTVMKCSRKSYLGPTKSFLVTKATSNVDAGVAMLKFNINAYKTDSPIYVDQIIVNPSTATWFVDADFSSSLKAVKEHRADSDDDEGMPVESIGMNCFV